MPQADVSLLAPRNRYLHVPWCWPPTAKAERLLTGELPAQPPRLRPGQAPLLAVCDTADLLLRLDLQPGLTGPSPAGAKLGHDAWQAWQAARLALAKLPLLWRADRGLRTLRPEVAVVHCEARPGRVCTDDPVAAVGIDGASFGLSMALAQTSWLLELALPSDVAMSVGLDSGGNLTRVDALERKLALVEAHAPTIRRVLVYADQVEEMRRSNSRLILCPVRTLADALHAVWPDLEERFLARGRNEQERADLVGRLFLLACGSRGLVRDWQPIRKTAEMALSAWPLDDIAQHRLNLVVAVALRHESNQGSVTLEQISQLRAQSPEPIRTELLAHAVQQSADTGAPDAEAVLQLTSPLLTKAALDWQPAELKVLGAVARLLAVQVRGGEALELARRVTEAWLDRGDLAQAQYPLCVWLRLAGLCGQPGELETAMGRAERVLGEMTGDESYVRLAVGQAMRWLGRADEARVFLQAVLDAHPAEKPSELPISAARHMLACNPTQPLRQRCHELLGLAELPTEVRGAVPWLARLDEAAASHVSDAQLESLLAEIQLAEPGPVGHILAAVGIEARARAEAVRRWFPY